MTPCNCKESSAIDFRPSRARSQLMLKIELSCAASGDIAQEHFLYPHRDLVVLVIVMIYGYFPHNQIALCYLATHEPNVPNDLSWYIVIQHSMSQYILMFHVNVSQYNMVDILRYIAWWGSLKGGELLLSIKYITYQICLKILGPMDSTRSQVKTCNHKKQCMQNS